MDQIDSYEKRIEEELRIFNKTKNVHDLPEIFHYWSNKYLKPKINALGIEDIVSLFSDKVRELSKTSDVVHVASLGAGDCEFEFSIVKRLIEQNVLNINFCCYEINNELLQKAKIKSQSNGFANYMDFQCCDINNIKFDKQYEIFMANHSLHHFTNLEYIFETIKLNMQQNGYFIVNDMIGRNGHMRWPEAYDYVQNLWTLLPDSYKWNNQLNRFEKEYENWDCSKSCFEGIRAQDILPLLIKNFDFELFYAFGNVIDIFVDRGFGPNFDPANSFDRAFIDFAAELDERLIRERIVKPTHLIAQMKLNLNENEKMKIIGNLSPEKSVRLPNVGQ